MFQTIIPPDLPDHNRLRAELLAAGLNGGALPTEQAAVALMLRLPSGVGLRDDVWNRYVVTQQFDIDVAANTVTASCGYAWTDLAEAVGAGSLPLSRGERQLVLAACAIASPMVSTPLWKIATSPDTGLYDLLLAAMYHAVGRGDPADDLADTRRRLEAERVETARLRARVDALENELNSREPVRGTEDGDGSPVPAGVDGHPVGHHGNGTPAPSTFAGLDQTPGIQL
jgi:hypothetical protein